MKGMNVLGIPLAAGLALAGCSKVSEPAPVTGGETLSYAVEGAATTKISLQADGDGFMVTADPIGGFSSVKVGADLSDGRKQLKLYYLGLLWLPPSARRIGAKTIVGDINEETTWNDWPVYVATDIAGVGKRYYHRETGFLVGLMVPVGGMPFRLRLAGTSIAGLGPPPR